MKNILFKSLLASFIIATSVVPAEIREIFHFKDVLEEVDENTLVLLDIDDTLIEPRMNLGDRAWRAYSFDVLSKQMDAEEADRVLDLLTYYLAGRITHVPIESDTVACLEKIQQRQIPMYGFTARGKSHWYEILLTKGPTGEELALKHLQQAGIAFVDRPIDDALFSHWSYGNGVFFAYPILDKGDLILELFGSTVFRPKKIVFVDDKRSHIDSVDRALKELQIPAVCFFYRHIDRYRNFDPMAALIQLEKLIFEDRLLSNEEAFALKNEYADKDPDAFFLELVSHLPFVAIED